MRRRTTAGIAAGAMAVLMLPAMSGAAPLTPPQLFEPVGFFRFCAEAQIDIANIDQTQLAANGGPFTITSTIYRSENDFVLSKSAVSTPAAAILTTQYVQYRDPGATQPELIRCKFRTGESLDQGAWPPGSENNGGRFAVEPSFGFGAAGIGLSLDPFNDQPCSVLNQRTIDGTWDELTPAEQAAAPFTPEGPSPTLVTVPDDVVVGGPNWTPPVDAVRLNGSVLEVPSRALLVNSGSAGVPRFEGAHYCTLVAPQYLRDILLGTAVVS